MFQYNFRSLSKKRLIHGGSPIGDLRFIRNFLVYTKLTDADVQLFVWSKVVLMSLFSSL